MLKEAGPPSPQAEEFCPDKEACDEEACDGAQPPRSFFARIGWFLDGDITPDEATYQLLSACYLTGFTSAIAFTATSVWCGYQRSAFLRGLR